VNIDKSKVKLTKEFTDWMAEKPKIPVGGQRPELFPFHRIMWRDPKKKREHRRIQTVIRQVEWETEYEMVKRGYRPCNVYQLDPSQFDHQIDKVLEDGLHYRSILRSKSYQGFGHRHYPTNEITPDSFIYGVVADTPEHAELFKEAHIGSTTDHKLIGKLLGYPECCTEWFCEVWLNGGCLDPVYETALNTPTVEMVGENEVNVTGPPEFNRMIRYWGMQVIPYFTHSYDCKESLKFAEKFKEIMYEKAPEEMDVLMEWLNMPTTWSMTNMIIEVKHPIFTGTANGYYWPEKLTVHWEGEG